MEEKGYNGNVFHLYPKRRYPVFERGEGIYLYDEDGKRYIDGVGGAAVVNIGHGVQEVLEAMARQARQFCYEFPFLYTSRSQEELARKVAELSPEGLSYAFFVSGGSEANETAIKLARQYQVETGHAGRYKVVSRWMSYHGASLGALSVTGRYSFRNIFGPLLLDFPKISAPFCYHCPCHLDYPGCDLACAHELERVIKLEGSEYIAAFLAEPVVGGSLGAVSPPPEYYPIIRSICDKYGILFIADEVITGFGRTGKNFGIDHWGVAPDMITTGKGIGGGYAPLGAVIVHERIYWAVAEGSGLFHHGFTYGGNPLSCAVGLAVLDYIEKNGLVERSARLGEVLLGELSRLKEHSIVADVRGRGLLAGVELLADPLTKTPFPKEKGVAEMVEAAAADRGLLTLPGTGDVDGISGDHILLAPPFVITEEQIGDLVNALEEAIMEVEGKVIA